MIFPFRNTSLNYFAVLITVLCGIPCAQARKGGGKEGEGGGENIDTSGISLSFPNPVDSASFAFSVIWAVFFFFHVLSALHRLIRPKVEPGELQNHYTVGRVFMGLLLLTTICLTAYHALFAVSLAYIWSDEAGTHAYTLTDLSMTDFTGNLSVLLIIAAILVAINHRKELHGLFTNRNKAMLKKAADAGVVLVLFIICIVIVGCESDVNFVISHTEREFNIPFNVYLAFYLLATAYVVVSAFLAWSQVKRAGIHDSVLNVIIGIICPMLVIRALFKLVRQIVVQLPFKTTMNLRFDVLQLCQIIIFGLTYLIATGEALVMGDPPENKQQEGDAGSDHSEGKGV